MNRFLPQLRKTSTNSGSQKPASKLDLYAKYGSTATVTYLGVSWTLSLFIYLFLHVGSHNGYVQIDPLKQKIEHVTDKYFGLKIDTNVKPLPVIPVDPTLVGLTLIISKFFVPFKLGFVGWLTPRIVKNSTIFKPKP